MSRKRKTPPAPHPEPLTGTAENLDEAASCSDDDLEERKRGSIEARLQDAREGKIFTTEQLWARLRADIEMHDAREAWRPQSQYLTHLAIDPGRVENWDAYPFNLPFAKKLHVTFTAPLTFFIGENGSGKSTIIEAIADVCRLPVEGGGRSELDTRPDSDRPRSAFARGLSVSFRNHVHDGFFVRAENMVRFADLLEARERDPDFYGNPYRFYGGRSLHEQSHGEAFLSLFEHRLQSGGVIIMDEPESALSPQRQLSLLAMLYDFVRSGNTQIIIASHSPILMTFPGAVLFEVSENGVNPIRLEDTNHYQITRGILANPEQYWKHLRGER